MSTPQTVRRCRQEQTGADRRHGAAVVGVTDVLPVRGDPRRQPVHDVLGDRDDRRIEWILRLAGEGVDPISRAGAEHGSVPPVDAHRRGAGLLPVGVAEISGAEQDDRRRRAFLAGRAGVTLVFLDVRRGVRLVSEERCRLRGRDAGHRPMTRKPQPIRVRHLSAPSPVGEAGAEQRGL